MKTPEEYVKTIDEKFLEHKKLRHSRFSVEWSLWSAPMNRMIRKRLQDSPGETKLKYVFIYWNLTSELLELHYKHHILRKKKKEQLREDLELIKKIIMSDDPIQPLADDDLLSLLLKNGGNAR